MLKFSHLCNRETSHPAPKTRTLWEKSDGKGAGTGIILKIKIILKKKCCRAVNSIKRIIHFPRSHLKASSFMGTDAMKIYHKCTHVRARDRLLKSR